MKRQLSRVGLLIAVAVALTTAIFATTFNAETTDQFYDYMGQALTDQLTNFTIQFEGDLEVATVTLPILQRELATWDEPSADNRQVCAYNLGTGYAALDGINYEFTEMTYLCTPDELAYVDVAAQEIANQLAVADGSDLLKIRSVYSYVTETFLYDETLTRFSAYEGLTEGTMVCQGYALLTSRILWALDMPNTIITGWSRSQNHAWVAVKYEDLWYNLDPTWDSADNAGEEGTWNFFMECEQDFSGHDIHDAYETARFTARHPMAAQSYPAQLIAITDGVSNIGSLIIRVGVSTSFTLGMPEGLENELVVWSTGNADCLTVTEDGTITGIAPGSTWLQVTAPNAETVFPKRLPVDVVDMTTLSPWAEEGVVEFYLATMLPASLCSDYQSTMSRAELARLTSYFIKNTVGFGSFQIKNLYEDMEGNPDVLDALRCCGLGLINGISETEFNPDGMVTREAVATIAVRLLEYVNRTEYEADLSLLDGETGISAWAEDSVAKAIGLGILEGREDGLCLNETMTREEVYLTYARVFAMVELEDETEEE